MNIEIGKQYENKTWFYLTPVLRGHGNTFITKFNSVWKLAVGIHDMLLDGSDIANGRNIYILFDKKFNESKFEDFLQYVKYQDYYKADYSFDTDLQNSRKHMIIIKVPKMFNNAYDMFLKGKYSKMYEKEYLEKFFSSKNRKHVYDIMTKKSRETFNNYIKKIEETFNVQFDSDDTLHNLYNGEWKHIFV